MRLIDADELIKSCQDEKGLYFSYEAAVSANAVEKAPTVDAVPVVRCKDCKWYQLDPWKYKVQCEKIYDVADGDLDAFNFRPAPEHFCAYGERKEGMSDGEKQ